MRSRTAWFCLAFILASAAAAHAANFTYDCRETRYVSRPAGQDYQFHAPIAAVPPGNDQVRVTFESHVPDSWFAQWCQVSTGICYFGNATITLTAGQFDQLDIDFFLSGDVTPQYGWVDLTFQSVADPLEVVHCTYTLFSGLPLPPDPINEVNCLDNTRQLQNWVNEVGFYTPIQNHTAVDDSLLVTMISNLPGDWGGQFCLQSTGTCYFATGTLPLPPGVRDSIHVQFFPGATPSQGALDFVVQSKRNPSIAQYCHYRVYIGQGAAGAGEAVASSSLPVVVVPNPSAREATIVLRHPEGGTGSLAIFAADGRLVREFPSLDLRGGVRELLWDGRDQRSVLVPSGAYFYRFLSDGVDARGLLVRSR